MEIVIIGSGNTATVLGHKLKEAGARILQVFSRNPAHAARLGGELGVGSTSDPGRLSPDAGLYLLAVSDGALGELAGKLRLPGKLVVHTAGAVSLNRLEPVSDRCGVLYPLQSLRRELRPFPEVPLLVDAKHAADRDLLLNLAGSISTQVDVADDLTRQRLHLSAVLVNNFVNHLYVLADNYCMDHGIRFQLLQPLIRETAERLAYIAPEKSQTGPAIRGDQGTIEKHLQLSDKYDDIKNLYKLFTIQIEERYHSTKKE